MKPLVSIIIPVKNNGIYAVKLLKTLRKDPYENLEIIFVDDGSKDGTPEKIKDVVIEEKLRNVKLFREDHEGIEAARNLGIEKSSGEYIIFLNPEDTIDENFITALMLTTINGERALALTGICEHYGAEKTKILFSTLTAKKRPRETTRFYRERIFKKDRRLHFLNNILFNAKIIKENDLKFKKPEKTVDADAKTAKTAETPELKFVKSYMKAGDIDMIITINKPLYHASHRRSSVRRQTPARSRLSRH